MVTRLIFWVAILYPGADGRRRNIPLRDSPGTSDPASPLEIPCEHRNQCGNFTTLPFYARNCFCDRECRTYGDCCRDSAENPDDRQSGSVVPDPDSLKEIVSCRRNEDLDTTYEMYIVDKCPKRYPNAAVRRKCQNELAPEVFYRVPVTGRVSRVLYRNVYCAICAGEDQFTFWDLAYKCNRREVSLRNLTTISSSEEFRRLIGLTGLRCTLELLPPTGLTPRKCKSNIDECDRKWKDERIARKCKSYTAYVYYELEIYRNKHCAICNSLRESSLTCDDQRTPYLDRTWDHQTHSPSTYIVYDFNSRLATVRRSRTPSENRGEMGALGSLGDCPEGSVHDVLTDECRCTIGNCMESATTVRTTTTMVKKTLTVGALTFDKTTKSKTRIPTTTVATKSRKKATTRGPVATARHGKKGTTSVRVVPLARTSATPKQSSTTSKTTATSTTRIPSTRVPSTRVPSTRVLSTGTSTTVALTYTTATDRPNTSTSPSSYNGTHTSDSTTVLTTVNSTDNIVINTTTYYTSGSSNRAEMNNASPRTTTLIAEIVTTDTATNSPVLTIVSTVSPRTEKFDTRYFGFPDSEEKSVKSRPTGNRIKSTPVPTFRVDVTLATAKGTTLNYRGSEKGVLSNGAEVGELDGETVDRQNCSDILVMFRYDRIQSLTSFVVTLISMVSLLVTFITILILPVLRTMRGKILLSLTLCLFIGQLLYLLALPSNQPYALKAVCYWLGCALHYFVLACFFWISVLAFDTSLSVTGNRVEAANGSDCGRYTGYSLYAWLSPAAIVATGTVIDFLRADHLLIRPCYGEGVCFVTGRYSLLLIVALPAGVLTLISVLLYFLAASHACVEASKNKSKRSSSETRAGKLLALCICLTLLVALTWAAGFTATFYGPRFIWWIFIALCPTQGIFIFLAFICRRTVINQLKNRGDGAKGSASDSHWSFRKDVSVPSGGRVSANKRCFGGSDTEIIAHETCM